MATSPEELKTSLECATATPSFDWSTCPPKLYEALKAVSDKPESDTLDLHEKKIRNEDVFFIVTFLNAHPHIKTLNLAHNEIGNAGAKVLAGNSTIEKLNLSFSRIGAEGAEAFGGNKTIKTLVLRGNKINDAGAKALARNGIITRLDLSQNRIGAEGAKALADNGTIKTLDMSSNRVGSRGAQAFVHNLTLINLKILTNLMSVVCAKALIQSYQDRGDAPRKAKMAFLCSAKKSQSSVGVFFKDFLFDKNILSNLFAYIEEPRPVLEGSEDNVRAALRCLETFDKLPRIIHFGEEGETKVSQEECNAMHITDAFTPGYPSFDEEYDRMYADDTVEYADNVPPPPDYETDVAADEALGAASEESMLQFPIDGGMQAPVVIWTRGAPASSSASIPSAPVPVVPAAPPVTETPEQRRQKLSAACRRRGV